MGFVDDILDVNECGNGIKPMHQETMQELNKRRLQVNKDKSVRIHITGKGAGKEKKCEELYVDSWTLKKEETNDGFVLKDEFEGEHPVKTVDKYEYLGNILEKGGSNKETINERVAKGQGVVRDIKHILEGCFFGDHYIDSLKIMRNSKLISVLTYNIEVIHNISNKEIKSLAKIY